MRRLRTAWIGLLTLVLPPLGLIQAGAAWPVVGVFAALLLAESALLTFAPPDGIGTLATLFGASILSHLVAVALALRAIRRAPQPLPWPRRWYALPLWAGLLVGVMPDTWVGAGYDVFIVPSGSMEPSLRVGERFFARASEISPPLRRGEIIVFRNAEDTVFVKRLVGLPGDRVQLRAGMLHINGMPARREALGPYRSDHGSGTLYRETLPGGGAHEIVEQSDSGSLDSTQEYHVPPGHVFVLGDNRDNSVDSRMLTQLGYVPLGRVDARARYVIWGPDWSRIGTRLD